MFVQVSSAQLLPDLDINERFEHRLDVCPIARIEVKHFIHILSEALAEPCNRVVIWMPQSGRLLR